MSSAEWTPPADFPRRELYLRVLAAERALREFRDRLGSRAKSGTVDKVEAARRLRENEEHAQLLDAYRQAGAEWAPAAPVICSQLKPGNCRFEWEGHTCGLKAGHPAGTGRAGAVDHACACGAMTDGPTSGDNYWEPVRSARQVRVVRCPICSQVAHMVGPEGEPQRQCRDCGHVWTPPPPEAREPKPLAQEEQHGEPFVMAAVP